MNWELAQELKQRFPQIHAIELRDSGGLHAYFGNEGKLIRYFAVHNQFDIMRFGGTFDQEWLGTFFNKEDLFAWMVANA